VKKLVSCLMMAVFLVSIPAQACGAPTLRLHVIGRTDLPEDQQFKLLIRDAALEFIDENGCGDTEALEAALNEFAARMHRTEVIRAERGVFPYPETRCSGRVYPAGDYDALRIYIGSAEGRNWWSMIFAAPSPEDEEVIYYSAIVNWFLELLGKD